MLLSDYNWKEECIPNVLTYRTFLAGYLRQNSALGDFARDAYADPLWKGKTVKSLEQRLTQCCEAARKAFETSVKQYEQLMKLAVKNYVSPS